MVLLVDTREGKLQQTLNNLQVNFTVNDLKLGDIIVDMPQHKVIIERKTVADFTASLRDGRYRNQKLRLLEWLKEDGDVKKNVMYILEDKGDKSKAYWGAIINAQFRDGIQVIQTDSLLRTAEVIVDLERKIEEGKFGQLEGGSKNISLEGYKKGDYNTPENCYLGQLSLIPNMSNEMAKIVAMKYGTMEKLLGAITYHLENENCLARDRLKFLADIKMGERRLGDKLAEKICQYLTQENESFKNWQNLKIAQKGLRKKKILNK